MDVLLQDLRYSIRLLAKRPGFTLVAVFTLAVGIGLNSAIFSVVNAVIVRPLPYPNSDRLIQVWERDTREGGDDHVVSPTNFFDWSKQSRSFEGLSAFWLWMPELSTADGTVKLAGSIVSSNFFETLGVTPQLGRTFRPEEELSDKNRVVVVSHQFWQNHLGGRPEAIGQPLRIDDSVYTVIGVLRPDYRHPESRWHWNESTELWKPLTLTLEANRGNRFLRVIGCLKQDVTLKQAQAEMTMIASQLEKAYPDTNTYWGANLIPLHEQFTGKFRSVLLLLQGAVGFVLLIACANLANLLLVRNAAREKELATRAALGESKPRLIRLLLTESLLLAGLGGIAGLFLAFLGVKLLSSFAPGDWTRLSDINVGNRVLGFTLLISLLTVLISGLAPALRAARVNINESLSGARQAAQGHNARGFLVI